MGKQGAGKGQVMDFPRDSGGKGQVKGVPRDSSQAKTVPRPRGQAKKYVYTSKFGVR